MADVNITTQKVITIPANTETGLVFDPGIQHLTIRNISLASKIFFRFDGVNAAIDDASCFFIDGVIAGLELYDRATFTRVSLITDTEQDIMLVNTY